MNNYLVKYTISYALQKYMEVYLMKFYHSIVRKVITATLAAAMLIAPTASYIGSPVADAVKVDSSTMVSADYATGIYTVKKNAKVRSGPGAVYEQLSTLVKGAQVTITEVESGWGYFFENDSSYGWVSMSYLELFRADSEYALGTYQCTASTLNVRSGPGSSYSSVGKIKEGQKVILRLLNGEWGYIRDESISGWVNADHLEYR